MYPLHRNRPSRSGAARNRRLVLAVAVCAALTGAAAFGDGQFAGTAASFVPRTGAAPAATSSRAPSDLHSADAAARVMREIPEKGRPEAGPGMNILLVGLDRRTGISKETRNRLHVNGEECNCTDVMMLLHIAADGERVSAVSIPRDSYVPFAPHREPGESGTVRHHKGKINAAYQHGGPALAVRTVEQATGVRVDHYAETGFTGFVDAVDATGPTRVCSEKAMRDVNAGLDLAAGHHELDGTGALRYVRARHVSPPGDLGRVRRQQRFVAETLVRLAGERVAGDEAMLRRVANALRATLRVDDGLTTRQIIALARELRGLRPQQTEFATVPMSRFDHRVPYWGSTLTWDEPRAEVLFGNLREDRPLTDDPRTQPPGGLSPIATPPARVAVRVEGGDAAVEVRRGLRENGFDVRIGGRPAGRDAGAGEEDATVITYDPRGEPKAQALATALPDAQLQSVRGHDAVPVVHVGREGAGVVPVVYDRSSVEGAPVTGDALDCGPV